MRSPTILRHGDPNPAASYAAAAAYLGGKSERPFPGLGRNTRLIRRGASAIALRLHSTDVATLYADGSRVFYAGDWHTMLTRSRLDMAGAGAFASRGDTYVRSRFGPVRLGWRAARIAPDGEAFDADTGAPLVPAWMQSRRALAAPWRERIAAAWAARDAEACDRLCAVVRLDPPHAFDAVALAAAEAGGGLIGALADALYAYRQAGSPWRGPILAALEANPSAPDLSGVLAGMALDRAAGLRAA